MNRFITPTVAILMGVTLFACGKRSTPSAMPPLHISVAEATTRELSERIYFSTSTEAIRSVTIEPRVSGYLLSIDYESGVPVVAGDVIFRIDPTQINTTLLASRAALESAEASLVEAKSNFERAVPLAKINAISQSSLDEYTATYRAAEAAVNSAEQTLLNAELNSSYTTIKAPIDGLVANTAANQGDYIGVGTTFSTLTTISDTDTVSVNLAIPISKYLRYMMGRESFDNRGLLSNIELILPDSSIYPHLAVYDYTEQSAASGSSSVVVVANIPNPELTLKGGMFARLRANIGEAEARVMVPQEAVVQMQGVSSVWVITPDSVAKYRRVELGRTYGEEWHIISGVESGEMVATTGQIKLHEGSKVVPTK